MEFKDNNLDNVYFDEKTRAYVKQDIGMYGMCTVAFSLSG